MTPAAKRCPAKTKKQLAEHQALALYHLLPPRTCVVLTAAAHLVEVVTQVDRLENVELVVGHIVVLHRPARHGLADHAGAPRRAASLI